MKLREMFESMGKLPPKTGYRAHCPECDGEVDMPDEATKVNCPHCGHEFSGGFFRSDDASIDTPMQPHEAGYSDHPAGDLPPLTGGDNDEPYLGDEGSPSAIHDDDWDDLTTEPLKTEAPDDPESWKRGTGVDFADFDYMKGNSDVRRRAFGSNEEMPDAPEPGTVHDLNVARAFQKLKTGKNLGEAHGENAAKRSTNRAYNSDRPNHPKPAPEESEWGEYGISSEPKEVNWDEVQGLPGFEDEPQDDLGTMLGPDGDFSGKQVEPYDPTSFVTDEFGTENPTDKEWGEYARGLGYGTTDSPDDPDVAGEIPDPGFGKEKHDSWGHEERGADEPGAEHRTKVDFPKYDGPKATSSWGKGSHETRPQYKPTKNRVERDEV